MKRKCALCGEGIPELDVYVLSAGSPVCSACILARGIQVRRVHPGRKGTRGLALDRPQAGAMAAGRT